MSGLLKTSLKLCWIVSNENEIILYQSDELSEHIEVRLEDETVWLTQAQMATLFGQTKQNISLHINNCFREEELEKKATVKESLTVQKEGKRRVKRKLEYYNLDVIISVGYRVKSRQGTQFRIWATRVLKDYLLKGYAFNQRIDRIENNYDTLNKEVQEIRLQLKTQDLPKQGIFFDGQIFDAYVFVADLIKRAKSSIRLIDNYVDDSVLTLLSKRNKNVTVTIYTKTIGKQLKLDLKKYNSQYPEIMAYEFKNAHDRFLVIDEQQLYHFGASLKDLGKKPVVSKVEPWFAFSRMDGMTEDVLVKLKNEGDDE